MEVNNTATPSWIGTHVPVSVSISNLLDEPVFLYEKDPNQMGTLAAIKKADVRPKILTVEAEIKIRLGDISSRQQLISETQPNISSETR